MHVQPLYLGPGGEGGGVDVDRLAASKNGQHQEQQGAVVDALEQALFVREGGFAGEGGVGPGGEAAHLMVASLPRCEPIAAHLERSPPWALHLPDAQSTTLCRPPPSPPPPLNTGLAGDPRQVYVCMAGMPGEVASAVSKRLFAAGVGHDRMLFADVV